MCQVKSLEDISRIVMDLQYKSHGLELGFYPTFEVDSESWESIQKEVDNLAAMMVPKIPYEKKDAWMSFMFCGVKCIVKPIQQPYKNSEVVNVVD